MRSEVRVVVINIGLKAVVVRATWTSCSSSRRYRKDRQVEFYGWHHHKRSTVTIPYMPVRSKCYSDEQRAVCQAMVYEGSRAVVEPLTSSVDKRVLEPDMALS